MLSIYSEQIKSINSSENRWSEQALWASSRARTACKEQNKRMNELRRQKLTGLDAKEITGVARLSIMGSNAQLRRSISRLK